MDRKGERNRAYMLRERHSSSLSWGERGCVALCGISADRNSCLDMSSWLLSSHWLVTEASVLHTIRPGLDGLLPSQFCYRPPIFSIVKSFVSYAYRSGTFAS
jgi:hypothetical protein